jgi:hypothetical protein
VAQPPLLPTGRTHVIALFDDTAFGLEPWKRRGYQCFLYLHNETADGSFPAFRTPLQGGIERIVANLSHPLVLQEICERHSAHAVFAFATPPANNLSRAGARLWKQKRNRDPDFQNRIVSMIVNVHTMFKKLDVPFYVSNPASSVLRRLWKIPNYTYHPFQYGKALPVEARHPQFPIIPNQDAYALATSLWTGGAFRMPRTQPVDPEWTTVVQRTPQKKARTRLVSPVLASRKHARARACVPRGFARALCESMHGASA